MYEAEVGDDVWNEDPTVHRLEELAAELTGKEAAVFVTSGTQGNLAGVLSHADRGQEVIVGDQSHVLLMEAAGTAVVGGVQLRTLPNRDNGRLRPDEVRAAIRPSDPHQPVTGCVVIENTHNFCGGAVLAPEEVAEIAEVAHAAGVPVHIDGARIFNAAVAQGVPVRDLVREADSVTFCLSKGLGAPVGSIICGSDEYIRRARVWRKMLGGGLRQAGVLAAAGIVALTENVERLADDHANARKLAEGLAQIPGIRVDPSRVQSNILFFDLGDLPIRGEEFQRRMLEGGVRVAGGKSFRAVTSYEVDSEDIDRTLALAEAVIRDALPVHV